MALQKDEDGNPIVPTVESPWTMTIDDPATTTPLGATAPKQGITDPPVPGATPAPTTPAAAATSPTDPAGMLDALYSQYGLKDYGRGSGFADRAYWLEHPSEILNGRLGRDLAGTGTDQPTGTPGNGPWINSGRLAPEAGIGNPTRFAANPKGFWDPSMAAVPNPNINLTATPTASQTTTGASSPTGPASQTPLPSSVQGGTPTSNNPNPTGGGAPTDDAYRTAILNWLTGGGAGGVEPTDPFGAKP